MFFYSKSEALAQTVSKESYDDFDLGSFTVVTAEKDLNDETSLATISESRTNYASGAISGTLFDPNGAVIPEADVNAVNQISAKEFSVLSNSEGFFAGKSSFR